MKLWDIAVSDFVYLLNAKCLERSLKTNFLFVGSEIYQETLMKALTKHFDARLLVVDSSLLSSVSLLTMPCLFFLKWIDDILNSATTAHFEQTTTNSIVGLIFL